MKTLYTVAFQFNPELSCVALIRKGADRGWQANKLNGIGGHVEAGEDHWVAHLREFREETGVQTKREDWSHFARIETINSQIDFFAGRGNLKLLRDQPPEPGKSAECIECWALDDIRLDSHGAVENLWWLICMAKDHLEDGRPTFAAVHYTSGDTVKEAPHE